MVSARRPLSPSPSLPSNCKRCAMDAFFPASVLSGSAARRAIFATEPVYEATATLHSTAHSRTHAHRQSSTFPRRCTPFVVPYQRPPESVSVFVQANVDFAVVFVATIFSVCYLFRTMRRIRRLRFILRAPFGPLRSRRYAASVRRKPFFVHGSS